MPGELARRTSQATVDRRTYRAIAHVALTPAWSRPSSVPRARSGSWLYFYYLCRGRQQHVCDLPYLPVGQVEDEVGRHYATVRLSEEFRAYMTGKMDQALADSTATRNQVRKALTKRLGELAAKEEHYFELVGHPDWPQEKLSRRMRKVAEESAGLRAQLDMAEVDLSAGRSVLTELCELLADPRELYQRASRRARRSLNKAIFTRLYLDADEGNRPVVSGDELNDGVAAIVRAGRQTPVLVGMRRDDGAAMLAWAGHGTGEIDETRRPP